MFSYQYLSPHPHVIKLSFNDGSTSADAESFFEFMESYLKRNIPFCLVLQTDGSSPFPQEERKRLGQWFKDNRSHLKKYCVGLVRTAKRVTLMEKFSSKAMSLAMPCPYLVTQNESQGLEWGRKLLSKSLADRKQ